MRSNRIEIKDLSFKFNENEPVLKNISIAINKGEFLSILGASGSGKSTLLRLISNILPVAEGEISIFGRTSADYLDTGKLSFMFQEASLMPNLNVYENIGFPLKLRGKKIDVNFINELLQVIGLAEHKDKYPSELSGGMKTRVSLARAFVTKPDVLLLDEPFSALDISWRYELYEYLKVIADNYNTTVVLVTHDIQESVLLGDKIIVLSKSGKILENRIPESVEVSDFKFDSVNKRLEANFDLILQLQNDILVDVNRTSLTTEDEFNKTYLKIKNAVDSGQEDDKNIFELIQKLRPQKKNQQLQNRLFNLWEKSNSKAFKFQLLWFLLDNPKAITAVHQAIFNFLNENESFYIQYGQNEKYFRPDELISKTEERIKNPDYPDTKSWLYLNHALLMSRGMNIQNDALSYVEHFLEKHTEMFNKNYVIHFLNNYKIEK